jgi:hypothetical protein
VGRCLIAILRARSQAEGRRRCGTNFQQDILRGRLDANGLRRIVARQRVAFRAAADAPKVRAGVDARLVK